MRRIGFAKSKESWDLKIPAFSFGAYMDAVYYVYQLRRADSELPFYIGKGKGRRARSHLYLDSSSRNQHKMNTIIKARREGVEIVIEYLATHLLEDEAHYLEREFIAKYGRRDLGTGVLTNWSDGGEGQSGAVVSAVTRAKISKVQSERFRTSLSEEHRKAVSRANLGRKLGPRSPEVRNRISKAKTGKLAEQYAMTVWSKRPEIWRNAQEYYEIWRKADRPGYQKLAKLCGLIEDYGKAVLLGMHRRFTATHEHARKQPWVPHLDVTWLAWLHSKNSC